SPADGADVQGCAEARLRAGRNLDCISVPMNSEPGWAGPEGLKSLVAALPRRPGVYRMYGAEGELLYVGKARALKDRVRSYFSPGKIEPKTFALVQQIANIEVTVTNSDTE